MGRSKAFPSEGEPGHGKRVAAVVAASAAPVVYASAATAQSVAGGVVPPVVFFPPPHFVSLVSGVPSLAAAGAFVAPCFVGRTTFPVVADTSDPASSFPYLER